MDEPQDTRNDIKEQLDLYESDMGGVAFPDGVRRGFWWSLCNLITLGMLTRYERIIDVYDRYYNRLQELDFERNERIAFLEEIVRLVPELQVIRKRRAARESNAKKKEKSVDGSTQESIQD